MGEIYLTKEEYLKAHPDYREYDGDGHYKVIAHPKSCFFCDWCTDIFYDSSGPYMWLCKKDGDVDAGISGECKHFKEEK